MLGESLQVPYRANDAIGTILVGSVLTLLSGLFVVVWVVALVVSLPLGAVLTVVVAVPNLLIKGYLLRVVEAGIHHDQNAPSFIKWGSLVRAGSKSTLISAFYLLPGVVLGGLVVGGLAGTIVLSSGFDRPNQVLTGILILVGELGMVGYGLVYLYVRPAARAVFATTGSVRTTMDVRRVLRVAATPQHLSGWLIAMGLLVIWPTLVVPLLIIAGVVGLVSPIGAAVLTLAAILLAIGLLFVARVSAAWITGRRVANVISTVYAITLVTAIDERAVIATADTETVSTVAQTDSEAPVAVQTGRAVTDEQSKSQLEPSTEQSARNGSMESGDSDTASASFSRRPDMLMESTEHGSATTSESTDHGSATTSESTDHGSATTSESTDHGSATTPTETAAHRADDDSTEPREDDRTEVRDTEFIWGVEDQE